MPPRSKDDSQQDEFEGMPERVRVKSSYLVEGMTLRIVGASNLVITEPHEPGTPVELVVTGFVSGMAVTRKTKKRRDGGDPYLQYQLIVKAEDVKVSPTG